MNKIDIGFDKLDKIFHIADIHIRNLKRHNEYIEVFRNLKKEIRARKNKNSIIYVGGDIAHAKTEMSPELVKLISEFLIGLANILPTIVITGNHDCNLNNRSRLDALTPIINNLNHPNLYYFKESGVYKIADCTVVHMSLFDDPETYIRGEDIDGSTKIALFHGPVHQSVTDVGYVINNKSMDLQIFDGYNLILLGDIHKHQILQKHNAKEKRPIIVYPGSLIQQNHGEFLKGHGMCVWDVPKRKFEFVEIYNDYGYYTLNVNNGKIPKVNDMPVKPRLRLKIKNTDSSQIKRIIIDIKKLYKVQEFTIIRSDSFKSFNKSINTNVIADLSDIDLQNKLIIEFLDKSLAIIDDNIKSRIREINRDLNQRLIEDNIAKNIQWVPVSFKFNNMFSYGENNHINFKDMGGVIGIFAPNTSGKSSIFDALSFCLFDKSSRTFKASSVLNDRKNQFACTIHFKIDNIHYYIERTAKKNKKGDHVKVNVNFWKIEADTPERISLNGEDRRDTNRIIRQYVGSYDDFVLTSLSLQNNNALFIDKSQTERKDLLSKFLGLDIFDKLYTLAIDDIRERKYLLRKFKKDDFTSALASIEIDIVKYRKLFDEINNEHSLLIRKKETIDLNLIELNKSLNNIDDSIIDIDKLNVREVYVLKKIGIKREESVEAKNRLIIINDKNEKLINDYDKLRSTYVENKIIIYTNKEKMHNNVKHEIEKLRISVASKLEKLKHLDKHEYDPNCKYCMNNIFVKDAIKTREELNNDRIKAEELIMDRDKIKSYLDINKNIVHEYNNFQKIISDRSKINVVLLNIENEIGKFNNEINNLAVDLKSIKDKIKQYYNNKKIIQENKNIQNNIDKFQIELIDLNKKIKNKNEHILKYHGTVSLLDSEKNKLIKSMLEAKELENEIVTYEHYINSIKRDGIPYDLISEILPAIETEINNILQQIVEFGILLEADSKNINAKIIYENREWPLELVSGMERFISGLAIRVALTSVSNLPRPNFLVIDEGLGTLDSENLNSMYGLFQYLKSQFDFVIMISHIEQVRDMVDEFIEIGKDNQGFSKINYL